MNDFLQTVMESCTSVALRILACLVILAIGLKLIKFIIKKIKSGKLSVKLDSSLFSFFLSLTKIALYTLLFLTTASVMGIPMASFVTILASAGVAVGLALQGALANLAGGVMLLFFRPFKIGDYIKSNDGEGTVKDITVFYTIITTVDNKTITIPNGSLTSAAITNFSTAELRRVDLTFSASYDSNISLVKEILLNVANSQAEALKEPEPFARLSAQKDSCLEFTLRVWCKSEDYWDLYYNLQEQVKEAFDKNGIEIPFPQLEIKNKNND